MNKKMIEIIIDAHSNHKYLLRLNMTTISNRGFIIAHLIELAHPLAMVGNKANINHKLIYFKLWKYL